MSIRRVEDTSKRAPEIGVEAEPGASVVFDWSEIRFVVFDVDGTLYRQSALRLRMARDMLVQALLRGSWEHVTVLRVYRRLREQLGDEEADDFDPVLIARSAQMSGTAPSTVTAVVAEWMEKRPLRYMEGCRYPGVSRLFAGLKASDRLIGVLSDYPVAEKLGALGLQADHVACASDPGIGILKPHPRGLQRLISAARVEPRQTVLIGDRIERDGLAARRAGAHALIRSDRECLGWRTFRGYNDPIFTPFLKIL